MNTSDIIDVVLQKVLRSEPGIKKVILVDQTGLTISHVSKASDFSIDVNGIGAIASAVYSASEEQGHPLKIGDLQILSSEFLEGKIFAAGIEKTIICIVTGVHVNIGMIRYLIQKAIKDLKQVLDIFNRQNVRLDEQQQADLYSVLNDLNET